MPTQVTIGDFSRMTHLTVKTLRHYHRVGLLEPADIDPHTGYRYYRTDQVPTAQIIRRFRQLDMPVDEVRAVLGAPDDAARNALIAGHLDRLQRQLAHTASAVASLQSLLESPATPAPIQHRSLPSTEAIAIHARVGLGELGRWWSEGFAELAAVAARSHLSPTGPPGGLYANELFEENEGEATIFLPVEASDIESGRVRPMVVPAGAYAVALHCGSHEDIDLAYGALGSHVAELGKGGPGPVRESYLMGELDTTDTEEWRTEIAWPLAESAEGTGR